jgi:cyclopropane fatty-acyl-phospholipid synthase-like methyltransferase
MTAPVTSQDFDRSYAAPLTMWGDLRIPPEVKELLERKKPKMALELGCGIGRICRYMVGQGLEVTGVDFSPVAIDKARSRVARDIAKPTFLVGDVTKLSNLEGPFDVSLDVGCFHCLDQASQRAYASEVGRLLKAGGTHLLWAMDHAPSDLPMTEDAIRQVFAPIFKLDAVRERRRRFVQSHWFWLTKALWSRSVL